MNINKIILYNLIYEDLTKCKKYNLGKNYYSSCRIFYNIINFHKYLLILFDLRSYYQLKVNYRYIKNLLTQIFHLLKIININIKVMLLQHTIIISPFLLII